jgi:hypothetical protein
MNIVKNKIFKLSLVFTLLFSVNVSNAGIFSGSGVSGLLKSGLGLFKSSPKAKFSGRKWLSDSKWKVWLGVGAGVAVLSAIAYFAFNRNGAKNQGGGNTGSGQGVSGKKDESKIGEKEKKNEPVVKEKIDKKIMDDLFLTLAAADSLKKKGVGVGAFYFKDLAKEKFSLLIEKGYEVSDSFLLDDYYCEHCVYPYFVGENCSKLKLLDSEKSRKILEKLMKKACDRLDLEAIKLLIEKGLKLDRSLIDNISDYIILNNKKLYLEMILFFVEKRTLLIS